MSFSITIEEREIAFLDEDKNILNSLERENVESHFHCRDGFCGACRCTLKKGTVEGSPQFKSLTNSILIL